MIKPVKEVAKSAKLKLKQYQSGEITPIITGREWLDDVFGGILPGDIITIAGQSGAGKSFEIQRLKNTIMDPNLNKESNDYVWLDYSLEMRFLSTMIRGLAAKLKKSKKKILNEEFTEEEKKLAKDYGDTLYDTRFFINEDVITEEVLRKELFEFCEQHKDKKAIHIAIDHIALFKDKGDKKQTVDSVVELINEIRKIYSNTYWFVLTQMNRNILGRIKDKDMMALPNRGDIFQSDTMFFISDYLYVPHNPFKLGIKEFLKVNSSVYDYLKEHFSEEKNGKASFDTVGKMFYIILKNREGDILHRDIFIEEVDSPDKEKYKEVKTFDSTKDDSLPVLTNPNTSTLRNARPEEVIVSTIITAVDEEDEDDLPPF